MNPNDPQDPFTQWLAENWQPDAPEAESFTDGIARRRIVHRRRRLAMTSAAIVIVLCGVGLWAAPTFTTPEATPEVIADVETETETETDFWASALDGAEDTQTIPDEYEALAGFFLGDS